MDVKQKAFKIKQTCMHKDRPGITNLAWRPKYFRKGKTIQKKLMLTRKKRHNRRRLQKIGCKRNFKHPPIHIVPHNCDQSLDGRSKTLVLTIPIVTLACIGTILSCFKILLILNQSMMPQSPSHHFACIQKSQQHLMHYIIMQ